MALALALSRAMTLALEMVPPEMVALARALALVSRTILDLAEYQGGHGEDQGEDDVEGESHSSTRPPKRLKSVKS